MYDITLEQLKEKAWAYIEGQMDQSEKNDYEIKLSENTELSQYVLKQKIFFDNLKKQIPNVTSDLNQIKRIEKEFRTTFKNFPVIEDSSWIQKIKKTLAINN